MKEWTNPVCLVLSMMPSRKRTGPTCNRYRSTPESNLLAVRVRNSRLGRRGVSQRELISWGRRCLNKNNYKRAVPLGRNLFVSVYFFSQLIKDFELYHNMDFISIYIWLEFPYVNVFGFTEVRFNITVHGTITGAISRLTQFETIGLRRDFMHGQQPAANQRVSGDCGSQYYAKVNKIGGGQLGLRCWQKGHVKIPKCV